MKYLVENKHTQIIKGRHGYYVINTHSPIGRALQFYGEHGENEINLLKNFIPKGSTVLDVGAHQGTHTLAFAKLVGNTGNVIAFEPQRSMFQIIGGTVALNELYNVRVYNFAVGEKRDTVKIPIFDYTRRAHFSGMKVTNQSDGENVIQVGIDDLITELAIDVDNISLMKIDVEGMEYQVLLGSKKLLSLQNLIIYFELHKGNQYYSQIIDLLRSNGYRIFVHTSPGFNPENFYGYEEDRFRGGVDHNAIAIHCGVQELPECIKELDELL
jgi:FkbM family methyltransferase